MIKFANIQKILGQWVLGMALCWGTGTIPVSADQLYIHNKPYKGTTSGTGAKIQAQLGALASALGLKITEVSANWVVTAGDEPAVLPADATGSGKVYFQGKVIAEAADLSTLVPVGSLAEAAGAMLRPNKSLQTVDVVNGVARVAQADAPKRHGSTQEAYVPTSKYRLIAFDATW